MVGYDLTRKKFLVKNSFGTEWGNNGYCWMTFDYVAAEVFDIWVYDPKYPDVTNIDQSP
jgi:C1A family cysteine protease